MRVVLVSGIPGAAKTTVARRLASRFQRSAHLEGDLIGHEFIVSGLVPPQGPPMDEAEAQLELRRRNICVLADSFAEAGFVPVIDDVVVSPSALNGYLTKLRTRPPLLVPQGSIERVVSHRSICHYGKDLCRPSRAQSDSEHERNKGSRGAGAVVRRRHRRRRCRRAERSAGVGQVTPVGAGYRRRKPAQRPSRRKLD